MKLTAQFYEDCVERIDYAGLPAHYRYQVQNWVERGWSPGDGLLFVLENNLKAILRFQDLEALSKVVCWVHNALPLPIWGSRKRVRAWTDLAISQSQKYRGVSTWDADQNPALRPCRSPAP